MPPESEQDPTITRREAIRRVSLLLGGAALIGCGRVDDVEKAAEKAASAPTNTQLGKFSAQEIAFLDEIAETIVPATTTPGAKDAKVGAFMALMVTDCYDPDEQKVFRDGMRRIDAAAMRAANVSFTQSTPQQRLAVLEAFDRQARREAYASEAEDRKRKGLAQLPPYDSIEAADSTTDGPVEPATFFQMMKELALLGYFTSEIGCTQALRYIQVPGRFDPCVDYVAGTPAWAAHA
jgi:hypothetical protein